MESILTEAGDKNIIQFIDDSTNIINLKNISRDYDTIG